VLERDGWLCRLGCTGRAGTVHLPPQHGRDNGGAHLSDDVFVSACLVCHSRGVSAALVGTRSAGEVRGASLVLPDDGIHELEQLIPLAPLFAA